MTHDLSTPAPLVFTLSSIAAWCAAHEGARAAASVLAPAARRRATPLELAVAEVAGRALGATTGDRAGLRVVLGSRFGELAATRTSLDSLTRGDGRVSPAAFSSSVHNASLGLLSIAQGIHAGSVAMSGGSATAYLCLVEAAALLHEEDAPVLVILADEAPQPSLGQTGRFPAAAIGLLLERARPRRDAAEVATLVVTESEASLPASELRPPDDPHVPPGPEARSSICVELADQDAEAPAWWPCRDVVLAATEGEAVLEVARVASLLATSSRSLVTGALRGRTTASLRLFSSDADTGLAHALAGLPHEPPARVVGFPAWSTGDGLSCTVDPRHGDPFVSRRQVRPGSAPLGEGRREDDLPGEAHPGEVVDAIACLEWIAQAAAWSGGGRRGDASDPSAGGDGGARGGALLATRELHLRRRWLRLGTAYRVVVRRVAQGEGLARFEGVVMDDTGCDVAIADVLVQTYGAPVGRPRGVHPDPPR